MPKDIQHKALGLAFTLPDLKQRDADKFMRAVRQLDPAWHLKIKSELVGTYAKAAIALGWYPGWTPQEVDDCETPGLVAWLANEADKHVGHFLAVPPDLNSL